MPKTKTTIGFIINPHSGVERNKQLQGMIEKTFSLQEFIYTFHETQHEGHATEIAKTLALANYTIVVAVGGDGTVNEVAKGIVHTQTALGIIPKGSGNGLARACGIPLQTLAAIKVLHKGYMRTIDVGMANNNIFVSNAGVGFDATITQVIKNETARGLKMYVRKTVFNFFSYKPQVYKVNINGEQHAEKAFMISVANGNEFGNGFIIAPTATLNDAELDVMIIKPLTIFTAVQVAVRAWRGNLHTFHKVKYQAGTHIIIENENLKHFQVDGELKTCDKKLEVQVLAAALNVIVP
jgi:diacylglycerol kinase (ATP)